MLNLVKAMALVLGLLTGAGATANAQYYNYYPPPYSAYGNFYYTGTPWGYYYPGYGYGYNYPTYGSYPGAQYPAPAAFWDPYVGWRPYSDHAGPKASGHGGP